jgi:hypothetical protein
MLTIIYLLFGTMLSDSTSGREQLAADYFFETIWQENYRDYKSIEFENKTDSTIFVGHVYGCRDWPEEDKTEIENGKPTKTILLNCKPLGISIKRRSSSRRLKLLVGRSIQVNDNYVVQVTVYKPLEFVDHYFIMLDRGGKIIDTCEFNEVI